MSLSNLMPNRTLLWKEWKYTGGLYLTLLVVVSYFTSFQFIMDLMRDIKYPAFMVGFEMSNLVGLYDPGFSIITLLVVVGIAAFTLGGERDKNTFNLMLAMPFTRQQIINSKFVLGIGAITTSFAVNALFVSLLMRIFAEQVNRVNYGFGFTVGEVWMWALINIIVLAFIFTFTLFISTLSGTSLGNGILSIIFLAFPVGFAGLAIMNFDIWFPATIYNSTFMDIGGKIVNQLTVPAYFMIPLDVYPSNFILSQPLAYSLLVLAVGGLYGLTVWSFNKNPMERNGEVLIFSKLEGVFKLGVTVCFSLLGGIFISSMFYDYGRIFALVGYLLTGALTWWAVNRLINNRKGSQ